jgi:colanic acid/amylovoran biosynthesis glycosyltransferase
MNNTVCLFTNEFPYGLQETFIENEIGVLCEQFDRVLVVPMFHNSEIREFPYKNLHFLTPVNSSRKVTLHKFALLFHLTFWSALYLGFKETGFSLKKIIKVVKQAFIISRLKKYIGKRQTVLDVDLWYFYWGTNAISVLPFLDKTPKSVVRYHGYDLYSDDIRDGQVQVFQEKIVNELNRAYFISEHGKSYFEEKYPKFKEKFFISRLGVPDRGRAKASLDNILRIVSCSSVIQVKRLHILAEALKEIDDIEIEWTHFGDGVLLDQIRRLINDLSRNISVTLKGRVKNDEIIKFYRSNPVDLFINVSQSEGAPVSIMEALSFGIPVYATKVGGTPELVSSENGKLLESEVSPSDLAAELKIFFKEKYGDLSIREAAVDSWKKLSNSESNYKKFYLDISALIER